MQQILTRVIAAIIAWQLYDPQNATAEENRLIFARICADREIIILTLIEDHGDIEDLPADKISEAYMALLRARATCYAGGTDQAVAQYDAVSAQLGGLHIDRRQLAASRMTARDTKQ
jgi:hypothetical protein